MQKKRIIGYLIYALLGNVFLFQWTYPAGGYGALAVLILAPLFNGVSLLLYLFVMYLLKRKGKADFQEIVVPAIASIALAAILLALSFTIYSHGGCWRPPLFSANRIIIFIHMYTYETITFPGVLLVAATAAMNFTNHFPAPLWQKLMPQKSSIQHKAGDALYSAEIFPDGFFNAFNPTTNFIKVAGIPVNKHADLPEGLEAITIPPGRYARFIYKGTTAGAAQFYTTIFTEVLPSAGLKIDNRPHLAIMDHRYKKDDPNSEEYILIPIQAWVL